MRWIIALIMLKGALFAGAQTSMNLTLRVETINKLAFSDVSPSIIADQFSKELVYGENRQGTYGILSNDSKEKKLTASLDQLFPDEIVLKISLGSEEGWRAFPSQEVLENRSVTLVEQISNYPNAANLPILYEIKAPRLTQKSPSPYLRTITFTLMDD